MPSVTEQNPLPPAKKRRREDDAPVPFQPIFDYQKRPFECTEVPFWPQPTQSVFFPTADLLPSQLQTQTHQPRKLLPLPLAKRARTFHDGSRSPSRDRQRGEENGGNGTQTDAISGETRPAPVRSVSVLLLSPCHICHRRPTKKSDLDSFADCEGCGARTCFVCIRECQGWNLDGAMAGTLDEEEALREQEALSLSFCMADVDDDVAGQSKCDREPARGADARGSGENTTTPRERQAAVSRGGGTWGPRRREETTGWTAGGHRQMVCSRCCIERGTEGDIVCLGCLSTMEAM